MSDALGAVDSVCTLLLSLMMRFALTPELLEQVAGEVPACTRHGMLLPNMGSVPGRVGMQWLIAEHAVPRPL